MAYSALVRCAGASGLNVDTVPAETSSLAWYCIQLLLDNIHNKEGNQMDEERLNRLLLTLISSIPSLPLVLMLQALEEIKSIITSLSPLSKLSTSKISSSLPNMEGLMKKKIEPSELAKALFNELIERVGYREKSAVMQWWYQNRSGLLFHNGSHASAEDDHGEIETNNLSQGEEVSR
jgi:hypothetical protein